MAISAVNICNMALGHLGRSVNPIQALTERSTEAVLCTTWFDICRQQVLEAQDWSFARQRRSLALHSDAPPMEWQFRYQAPSDMIVFRRIWNSFSSLSPNFGPWPTMQVYGAALGDAIPYELESSLDGTTTTILTNQETAIGLYTQDVTLTQRFSPLFINAFAHFLASKLAFPLTGKQSIEDKELKAFGSALAGAAASDANQGINGPVRDAEIVRARL